MKWRKLGRIYVPDGSLRWAKSHAMIPTPVLWDSDTVRVFITCCDEKGIGRIGFVDVSSSDPAHVLKIAKEPVLDIGKPGTFDENGVLVCSVAQLPGGTTYLYYVGFELGTKIRYRLLTGLAVHEAEGCGFRRAKKVPILERSEDELYFRGGPHVVRDASGFRMWYVAGSAWEKVGASQKPIYEIRYLESRDGVHWPDVGKPGINVEFENEYGFGRPYVFREGDMYKMFYSIRRRDVKSYRLGYAESTDGMSWVRRDAELGLDVSASGWDSEMICYSAVIELLGRLYMFYNGNNFGETGFGLAMLER